MLPSPRMSTSVPAAVATHPVAQVLGDRMRSGSRPGAREDPHRVALVVEGGGMRGVVSAGMAAALERIGLTPAFDLVAGASAGAINGAALLAGVAGPAVDTYTGPLASRAFINPLRLLRGRPVLDVNDILKLATGLQDTRHDRITGGSVDLHCVAVEVDSARTVTLRGMRTEAEIWDALLASSRMPWAGGPPVEVGGRRYLDGGMGSPVPVTEALADGATHVLVLQTRPHGVPRTSTSRVGDRLIERHLRGLNPALVGLYRGRLAAYASVVEDIARRTAEPGGGPPHVLGLRPPAGTPCVGQLERDPAVLGTAAADARRLVEAALGGLA